ncbi:Holliday junction resolvase RuvX [Chlamydia sp. 17-3921]|uniref:Holliday junction resolvase RuvX n=1 Tax=Chlamydia sp. 17-3921 TaxID=2675798 RepID=UPI00191B21E0|nr:Holliday junction resolvase RuvX [Chlamydia sp. 17-3921]
MSDNIQANKAFLGVDYGQKRIGLACASYPLFLSIPIGTIEREKNLDSIVTSLQKIIVERKITCVILGNPLPMYKGQVSPLQKEIILLSERLKEVLHINVILWDERLSSTQAEKMLKQDCGLSRKQRTGKTDALAATLILSSFLESSLQ